jgi:hypothetical protein
VSSGPIDKVTTRRASATSPVATLNLHSKPSDLTWSGDPHVSVDNCAVTKTAVAVAAEAVATTRCGRRGLEVPVIGVM